MIDAYDTLGIAPGATEEDVRKAFKQMSLKSHPDKLQASGVSLTEANEKFNEVKLANDILKDEARRKIYDTFGVDLGSSPPENEFWTLGCNTMLVSIGSFTLRTFVFRVALWFLGFRFIAGLLLLAGMVLAGLYKADFSRGSFRIRAEEYLPIIINVAVIDAVVVLHWVWSLLADTVGVLYLIVDVIGLELFLQSWKLSVGISVVTFFFSWLVQNWWLWILGLEVGILFVVLISLIIAVSLMKLWLDSMEHQHSEPLKTWRMAMRKKRKEADEEIEKLQKKIQELEKRAERPTGKA